jgi:hypothetical protein
MPPFGDLYSLENFQMSGLLLEPSSLRFPAFMFGIEIHLVASQKLNARTRYSSPHLLHVFSDKLTIPDKQFLIAQAGN